MGVRGGGFIPPTARISYVPVREGGDQMRWKLKSSGDFSVRSSYEALRGSPPVFLWRAIWGAKAPQRVSFLC